MGLRYIRLFNNELFLVTVYCLRGALD